MPAPTPGASPHQHAIEILVLSNGTGEDLIACSVARSFLGLVPGAKVRALPLVGDGQRYREAELALIASRPTHSDAGFRYLTPFWLVRDMGHDLPGRVVSWRRIIRDWCSSTQGAQRLVIAVGDVVPLALARLSGPDLVFIGCAKSEYYRRDRDGPLPRGGLGARIESRLPSVYGALERRLMKPPKCRAVFPRDSLTAQRLHPFGLAVQDLGNPMMDGLQPRGDVVIPAADCAIALVPGSRHPESLANWRQQLDRLADVIHALAPKRPLFLAPIPQAKRDPGYRAAALERGWLEAQGVLTRARATLILTPDGFADTIHRADLAIAQAGTASEQIAGLGKPIISFPGEGPQFVHRFAEAQARLLGPLMHYLPEGSGLGPLVAALIDDRTRRRHWRAAGVERMGRPGASDRIARAIAEIIPAASAAQQPRPAEPPVCLPRDR